MFETAAIIKNSKKFFTGKDRRVYCLGLFSGYLLCNFNYAEGISLRIYKNLLAMIERGASIVEVAEYLEASINKND